MQGPRIRRSKTRSSKSAVRFLPGDLASSFRKSPSDSNTFRLESDVTTDSTSSPRGPGPGSPMQSIFRTASSLAANYGASPEHLQRLSSRRSSMVRFESGRKSQSLYFKDSAGAVPSSIYCPSPNKNSATGGSTDIENRTSSWRHKVPKRSRSFNSGTGVGSWRVTPRSKSLYFKAGVGTSPSGINCPSPNRYSATGGTTDIEKRTSSWRYKAPKRSRTFNSGIGAGPRQSAPLFSPKSADWDFNRSVSPRRPLSPGRSAYHMRDHSQGKKRSSRGSLLRSPEQDVFRLESVSSVEQVTDDEQVPNPKDLISQLIMIENLSEG